MLNKKFFFKVRRLNTWLAQEPQFLCVPRAEPQSRVADEFLDTRPNVKIGESYAFRVYL